MTDTSPAIPTATTIPSKSPALGNTKTIFSIYLGYRLVLSAILLFSFYSGVAKEVIGASKPDLFLYASMVYLLSSIASLFMVPAQRDILSSKRVVVTLSSDVLVQIVLIYASGGLGIGLDYLLIISAAMGSMLLRGKFSYAFAAFISICLLAESFYLIGYQGARAHTEVFSAGVLGILIFLTTAVIQYFTKIIQASSRDAEEKSKQAQALTKIAQNIVTRMQTGVVVVGNTGRIEMINDSACDMLNLSRHSIDSQHHISDIAILEQLHQDQDNHENESNSNVVNTSEGIKLRVNSAQLESEQDTKTIFYLENYSNVIQQAQKMKLASLGRLAASIAHEIRNPLGAASHATQLLKESPDKNASDARLIDIILSNCGRVNEIIESTLSLSRRKAPTFERLDLNQWVAEFLDLSYGSERAKIQLQTSEHPAIIRFDAAHLKQIISNLIDNALHYSRKKNASPWVNITIGVDNNKQTPNIEIQDNGEGVPQENIRYIFEPFFTTNKDGSGLGLYLSKELAEINHATLRYYRNRDKLSCFRLDFVHYQRVR